MGCCASSIEPPPPINYYEALMNDTEKQYSFAVEGSKEPGVSSIFRHKEELLQELVFDEQKMNSIWDVFQYSVAKYKDSDFLGTRPYTLKDGAYSMNDKLRSANRDMAYFHHTYGGVDKAARNIAAGLIGLDIGLRKDSVIGVYSTNRVEYTMTLLGCFSQSFMVTPIYDTLGPNILSFIINHAEVPVLFLEKSKMKTFLTAAPELKGVVKVAILFDYYEPYQNIEEVVDSADVEELEKSGIRLMGFSDLLKLGKATENVFPVEPTKDDVAYIMYTSGTTGAPKGACITHNNVIITGAQVVTLLEGKFEINSDDTYLSYLPLAHIFESVAQVFCFFRGITINFYTGNIKTLAFDLQLCRPTVFAGVPRIYQRFYDKVYGMAAEGSSFKKGVFNAAMASATEALRTNSSRNWIYEALVFSKIRANMGFDRLKMALTAAAPLPSYVHEFMRVVTNTIVSEGYGMTETAAGIMIQSLDDFTYGSCGTLFDTTEVRLEDVPDMKYYSTDEPCPRGELCVRGAQIFPKYWKDPEKTAETISADGWLHTGDIARINPNGTVSIIDRKKNIFKLLNGEYIAAEKLENIFGKAPLVGQVWVYGNSFKNHIVCVVVPSAEVLVKRAMNDLGWWPADKKFVLASPEFCTEFHAMCQDHRDDLNQLILEEIKAIAKEARLNSYEVPKGLILETVLDELLSGFNVSNDLATPTFKIKRVQLYSHYLPKLKALYTDMGCPDEPGTLWPNDPGQTEEKKEEE